MAEENSYPLEEIINAGFFITLFDPVRFQLFNFLSSHGKQSISDIAKNFPQDRSVISRHLDQMHRKNILTKEKKSKFIYYDLNCEYVTTTFEETAKVFRDMTE